MYVNSSRMKFTLAEFAPESRKITTRFPVVIIVSRVGQADVSEGVDVNGGIYAIPAIPAVVKAFPQSVTSIPSGLVNRIVKTTR
jgi:hypothetical protein